MNSFNQTCVTVYHRYDGWPQIYRILRLYQLVIISMLSVNSTQKQCLDYVWIVAQAVHSIHSFERQGGCAYTYRVKRNIYTPHCEYVETKLSTLRYYIIIEANLDLFCQNKIFNWNCFRSCILFIKLSNETFDYVICVWGKIMDWKRIQVECMYHKSKWTRLKIYLKILLIHRKKWKPEEILTFHCPW